MSKQTIVRILGLLLLVSAVEGSFGPFLKSVAISIAALDVGVRAVAALVGLLVAFIPPLARLATKVSMKVELSTQPVDTLVWVTHGVLLAALAHAGYFILAPMVLLSQIAIRASLERLERLGNTPSAAT